MRALVLSLVPMFVLAGGAVHAQTATDVVGVSLGMTVDDARKAVEASGSGWSYRTSTYQDGRPGGFTAAKKDATGKNVVEKIVVLVGHDDGKAYLVGREVLFPADSRPLAATVLKAVEDKYGRPSYKHAYSYPEWYWATDASGKPLLSEKTAEPCFRRNSTLEPYDPVSGLITQVATPTSFNPSCGVSIRAQLTPKSDNPDLALGLTVAIMDDRPIIREIQGQRDAEDQRRRQEEDRARKAASDKPKL